MIKVLHVLTDKNIGGAGRWLLNYLACHDSERFEVQVLLPEGSELAPRVRELGVNVTELAGMRDLSWDKSALRGLTDFIKKQRPDIVHTHASLTARLAARLAGVRHIVATKHCMESPPNLKGRVLHGLVNRLLAERVIAVSEAVGESLAAGGTPRGRIVMIYNGVQDIPAPDAEEQALLRQRWGIAPSRFWVGTAARLEPVKDIPTFLAAARIVGEKRTDIGFVVMGTGSLEAELRASAPGNVLFTGFVREVEGLLSLMDVNVICSRQEALCLSIIEGMAQGVPALGADSGGVGEVITDGADGFTFAPGDAEMLAELILSLAENDELRGELSRAARDKFERVFTAQRMTESVERLYAELCG